MQEGKEEEEEEERALYYVHIHQQKTPLLIHSMCVF